MDSLSATGHNPTLRQKVAHIFKPSVAGGVILKNGFDNFCFLAVNNNTFCPHIVDIANRRNARIFSASHFLAQTTLRVFGKRIHIVFALPKCDIQHKFSLRRWFKPELRKFQRRNMPAINEINNLATINRIARQSIGMPSQNSVHLAMFKFFQHFAEYRTARNFGRLFFHKLLNNGEIILLGKGAQFCDLRFNTQNLFIFHIGRFAGVEEKFMLFIHIFIGLSKYLKS
ncbi:MAG TPA: hypothetical protein VJB56_00455 [Candidatus Paceibacterota bacterium]